MKYVNVISAFYESAWAILATHLAMYESILMDHVRGDLTSEEIESRISGVRYGAQQVDPAEKVAVIKLHGPIMNRASSMDQISGYTSPQDFAAQVAAAAADESIEHIVIDTDSPGGTVSGTGIAADAVRAAAGMKPVTAVVNDMMASAAYWIGSQATSIVAGPTSTVGSIGVIWPHRDLTEAEKMAGQKTTYIRSVEDKALGQPFEAMTPEVRESMQEHVDGIDSLFREAVAEGRGAPLDVVEGWTAKTFLGAEAVEMGLADSIGTLQSVVSGIIEGLEAKTGGGGVFAELAGVESSGAPEMEMGEDGGATLATSNTHIPALEPNTDLPDTTETVDPEREALLQRVKDAEARADKIEADNLRAEAEGMVKAAVATGRALPAQQDSLVSQAINNFEFVQAFLDAIPNHSVTPAGSDRLTPEKGDRVAKSGSGIARKFLENREKASASFENPLLAGRDRTIRA